jgi:hypothetical protein
MRIITALILSLCCVSTAVAAGKTPVIVFALATPDTVATKLTQRADYVSLSLTISSEERDPEKQYEELNQAIKVVRSAAKGDQKIDIYAGPVYLSSEPKSKIASSSYQSYSQAQLNLLATLGTGDTLYSCAASMQRFVKALTLPGKSKSSIGQIRIAVKNPEQHRDQLIKMIADAVKKAKDAFEPGAAISLKVEGLENPVSVRQLDDEHVELFIGHSIHMDVKQ